MKDKKALVLSGGGAKGCYEVGAWGALREAGYRFDAVAGTSVGSMNAAMVAQDRYEDALELWNTITLDQVIHIPKRFLKDGQPVINAENIRDIRLLNRTLVKGRLNSEPLKKLIHSYMNEKLIRNRKVDFGMVTYNLSELKPVWKFADQIPDGSLADYVLASASFPVFTSAKINGKSYIDGGIHDNIPFNMIKKRGYKDIVVIDISGLGANRRPDLTGTRTLYIKNSMEFGSISDFFGILKFEPQFLRNFRELGYLDTWKALGRYSGHRYFVECSERWLDKLEGRLISDETRHLLSKELIGLMPAKTRRRVDKGEWELRELLDELLPVSMRGGRHPILAYLECAAFCLGLEVLQSWKGEELLEAVESSLVRLEKEKIDPSELEFRDYTEFLFTSSDPDRRAEKMVGGSEPLPAPLKYEKAALAILGSGKRISLKVERAMINKFPQLLPAKIFFSIFCEERKG